MRFLVPKNKKKTKFGRPVIEGMSDTVLTHGQQRPPVLACHCTSALVIRYHFISIRIARYKTHTVYQKGCTLRRRYLDRGQTDFGPQQFQDCPAK